ncbi:peroxiredoxin [Pseudonocardia sulfidoxydans NBRC 16205]|uniref:Glutathione-dependent peroxiredoxin n=1 Tax=Pseudonocardia sulfidoxydans NBRC 16205 TaxID=1223511 RepID=A0A511DQB2_9PSEU|nr:peroxiredoxin [Pseudonocardia sulfidoxydans]GEL27022.1 peroxiredoxin [Pseudonocardia sulfidoxydans NBRC 16205]
MASVGDSVPDVRVMINAADGPQPTGSGELLRSGKILLIGVPGAFTPVCTDHHLPGLVSAAGRLAAKGIEKIVVVSVNDAFVMNAWAASQDANEGFLMMADPDAEFTRAMGLAADASEFGLGVRSERYAAVVEDGVIRSLDVEAHFTENTVSSAEAIESRL